MLQHYSSLQHRPLLQHRYLLANVLLLCLVIGGISTGQISAQTSPEEEALSRAQAEAARMRTENETMQAESTRPFNFQHANRQASDELLKTARLQPDTFIGKILHFSNGTTVGPVLDLRRRKQDNQLYLIVDATRYFNEATEYAVAVRDVSRLEENHVIIPMATGMHLRGLVYYPEDYRDH